MGDLRQKAPRPWQRVAVEGVAAEVPAAPGNPPLAPLSAADSSSVLFLLLDQRLPRKVVLIFV